MLYFTNSFFFVEDVLADRPELSITPYDTHTKQEEKQMIKESDSITIIDISPNSNLDVHSLGIESPEGVKIIKKLLDRPTSPWDDEMDQKECEILHERINLHINVKKTDPDSKYFSKTGRRGAKEQENWLFQKIDISNATGKEKINLKAKLFRQRKRLSELATEYRIDFYLREKEALKKIINKMVTWLANPEMDRSEKSFIDLIDSHDFYPKEEIIQEDTGKNRETPVLENCPVFDNEYQEKRHKNNISAKHSREGRKLDHENNEKKVTLLRLENQEIRRLIRNLKSEF